MCYNMWYNVCYNMCYNLCYNMCYNIIVTSLTIPLYTTEISQLAAVKRPWTTGRHFIARQKQLHPLHDT